MSESKQNQGPKNTLTDHVARYRKEQNEIMRGFRFKFPLPEYNCQSSINIEMTQTRFLSKEKTIFGKGLENTCPKRYVDNFYRVDNKASIIGGKLVLFENDQKNGQKNGRELMKILRENNIDFKEYMLGDKAKFHKQIVQRQKLKEEELIKDYVDKHLNMEKTTKIQIPDYSLKTTCTTLKTSSNFYTK